MISNSLDENLPRYEKKSTLPFLGHFGSGFYTEESPHVLYPMSPRNQNLHSLKKSIDGGFYGYSRFQKLSI